MKALSIFIGLVIFLGLALQSPAQKIKYDFQNYKTANYERSSMDLFLNLNESVKKNKEDEKDVDYNNSLNRRNLQGIFNLDYSIVKLTRKKYEENNASFSTNFTSQFEENFRNEYLSTSSLLKSSRYIAEILVNRSVSNFYSPTFNKFWEYKFNASFGLANSYSLIDDNTNRSEISQSNIPANASIYIGHGFGRIEFAEDAVEAIYILEELQSKGLITTELNDEDITQFADKISTLKKKRFYDSRIYKQEVIEELVQFLKEENIVQNETVGLFNTVNDYHFMAGIHQRKSGHKFAYGVIPTFAITQTNSRLSDSKNTSFEIGSNIMASYENHKVETSIWQKDFYADIVFGIQDSKTKNSVDVWNSNQNPFSFNSSANYTLGYYPNTRTYFGSTIYCNLNLNKILQFNMKSSGPDYDTGLNFNGYYYISEHLRLNGKFNFGYSYDSDIIPYGTTDITLGQFAQSFNLSFNYYIF